MSTNDLDSYPPPFRHLNQSKRRESSSSKDVVFDDPIPLIDFQGLLRDENDSKGKLGEACEDWGLFRLVNHGIPPNLMTQMEEYCRELLSLSFDAKTALLTNTNPVSYFWGTPALTPSGSALSRGGPHSNINWVEGLNVFPLSQIQPHHHHDQQEHTTLDSFRVVVEEYGKHMGTIARAIFKALSEKLNVKETESNMSESTGLLRIYRYPRYDNNNNNDSELDSESESGELWGMDVHTDSSVLSILNQDQVGGLEVLNQGQWFTVKPLSNTLIVNLGDMMQAISDDKYKSVKHRVKVSKSKERFSICYFVFPSEGNVIRSSKYKPFTYRDFQAQVQQDIKTLGCKVGLERFKLVSSLTNTCQSNSDGPH